MDSEESANENQTCVQARLEVVGEPSTCRATPRSHTAGVWSASDLRGSRRRTSCAPLDPEGSFGEPPARVVASREPSATIRPTSKPRRTHQRTIRARPNSRGTHLRTSKPRQRPEGHINDSSARARAPGTNRRPSDPRPSPEGLISEPSERVHAPRDPSPSLRTTSAPRRVLQQAIDPRPGLRDLSLGFKIVVEIRKPPQQPINPVQAPPEPVGERPDHPITPKGSRVPRQHTSRPRGARQHQSSAAR